MSKNMWSDHPTNEMASNFIASTWLTLELEFSITTAKELIRTATISLTIELK